METPRISNVENLNFLGSDDVQPDAVVVLELGAVGLSLD